MAMEHEAALDCESVSVVLSVQFAAVSKNVNNARGSWFVVHFLRWEIGKIIGDEKQAKLSQRAGRGRGGRREVGDLIVNDVCMYVR